MNTKADGSLDPSSNDRAEDLGGEGTGRDGTDRFGATGARDRASLLDMLVVLVRNRTLFIRIFLAVVLLGLTYSFLAAEEYTSYAVVVRETQDEGPNISGLGGLGPLQGLGLNLGGASGGLSAAAFPDVLHSREVRLAVVRDTFSSLPDADQPMTFVEYVNRPPDTLGRIYQYTVKLPWTLKDALFSSSGRGTGAKGAEPAALTSEERKAMNTAGKMLSSEVMQSGLMKVSVSAQDPALAAELTESFVDHLRQRVRELRTGKIREQLTFVEERFREVGEELEAAENQLAQFLERNQNPSTASLQFKRDRLRQQVNFKEQLYSKLQEQVTSTRLDLQRRQPVVTVVESPVPSVGRDWPQRTLIMMICVVLGGFLGVAGAFIKSFFVQATEEKEREEKLEELREALVPDRLQRYVSDTFPSEKETNEAG